METITIPKTEYRRLKDSYQKLKNLEKIDAELVQKIKRSLEDIKQGRITEWKKR